MFKEIAALGRLLSKRFDQAAFAVLNARVALLYQLSVEEFQRVLDTFPLVAIEDLHAALREYRSAKS